MSSLFHVLYRLSQINVAREEGSKPRRLVVDLNKRQAKVGRKVVVDNGSVDTSFTVGGKKVKFDTLIDKEDLVDFIPEGMDAKLQPYEAIEYLYEVFYSSVPDIVATNRKQNFIGKQLKDFGVDDFKGVRRSEIQLVLELYVLLAGMQGWIPWEEEGNFFWKGTHPNLYIFKKWIKND